MGKKEIYVSGQGGKKKEGRRVGGFRNDALHTHTRSFFSRTGSPPRIPHREGLFFVRLSSKEALCERETESHVPLRLARRFLPFFSPLRSARVFSSSSPSAMQRVATKGSLAWSVPLNERMLLLCVHTTRREGAAVAVSIWLGPEGEGRKRGA